MTRADITLGEVNSNLHGSQSNYLVIDPAGSSIYNIFWSSANASLCWQASYDGGYTWGAKTVIKGFGTTSAFAVWYDRWTPGDTGNVIHIAYFEPTSDDVFYRSLNTVSETLGTEVTIFAGASVGALANDCISITKAIGGNLYCAFDIDGGTETGFYRSTDAGSTWTSRSNVNEAANTDYYLLAPGFAADNQDIICIFWDRSASEISRKLYDDSGDAWTETSIAGSMTSIANSTSSPQFSITVDDTNNKILLAAWSNRATLNADLRFWTIDESSITEGTNVVLNSGGNQLSCSLSLVSSSGLIYCFYIGKSDGTETAGGSINVYYKTSSDGGTTWGSETLLSRYPGNTFNYVYTVPVILDTSGKFWAVYLMDTGSANELYISAVLPSGGGGNVAAPILGNYILQ